MNNFAQSIKLEVARKIFAGADFQPLPTGGYQALYQGCKLSNKSLTGLCIDLWQTVSGLVDPDVLTFSVIDKETVAAIGK